MTPDLIQLAKEAGFDLMAENPKLAKFATLVRNAALEEGAQKCMEEVSDFHSSNESRDMAETLAQRIRNLKDKT